MGLQGIFGEGGEARVWRAASPGMAVALRLESGEANGPNRRNRPTGHVLPRHPHILAPGRPIDAGPDVATVVPLLLGGSMADRLSMAGPLPPHETVQVLVSMSDALAALHATGLVHLDISPANIMVSANGCPVLIDTDGAVPADGRHARRGTPPYTVPGVIATPHTDWVALGRVITELASGSSSTVAERLPHLIRDAVIDLLDGSDPRANLPELDPDQRLLQTLMLGQALDVNRRVTVDFDTFVAPPAPLRDRGRTRALGLVAATLLLFTTSASLGAPDSQQCPTSAPSPASGFAAIEVPTESPCPAQVFWSQSDGVLVVPTTDGAQRFKIGEAGDELSFGDWNCDGSITPALGRDGQLFVFEDWPQHSVVEATKVTNGTPTCAPSPRRRGG